MPDGTKDNLKSLHTNLVNDGFDVPDFDKFKSDMQSEKNLSKLWGNLKSDYELPDFNTFKSDMGIGAVEQKQSATQMLQPWQEKQQEVFAKIRPVKDPNKEAVDRSIDLYNRAYALDPNSPKSKQKRKEYEDGVANGEYSITLGPSGRRKLARNLKPLEGYTNALKSATKSKEESDHLKSISNDDAVKYIEDKFSKEEVMPLVSQSITSKIAESAGGLTRLIAKQGLGTTATEGLTLLLAPETGGLSLAALGFLGGTVAAGEEIGAQEYGANLQKYYLEGKSQGLDKKQAIEKARQQASYAEKVGYAEAAGYGLAGKAVGKLFPKQIAGEGVKKMIGKAIVSAAPEVIGTNIVASGSSVAKDLSAKELGYNVTNKEIFDNAWDAASENTKFMAGLLAVHGVVNGAVKLPKYLHSQLKNYVSSAEEGAPETILNNLKDAGVVKPEEVNKTIKEINDYRKVSKDIEVLGIEDEAIKGSITGKYQKRKKLEGEISDIKKMFGGESPVGVDEKVAEIKKIDEDIRSIYKTGDIEKYEQDSDFPTEPEVEVPSAKELTPTIVINGKEYQGVNHGEAMDAAMKAGENIPDWRTEEGDKWRIENGLFKDKEGKILTREESKQKYGVERSAELATAAPTEVVKEEKIVPQPKITAPEKIITQVNFNNMSQEQLRSKVNEIGEVQDARGLAMKALMGGAKVSEESFKKEFLGFGESKVKRRGKMVDEARATSFTRKEGQTIKDLAHSIWDNLPEEIQPLIDTEKIRNEIINVMSEHDNVPDLRTAFVEEYYPKELSDQDYMMHSEAFKAPMDEISSEWEKWMAGEGEKEMALELDENYVDELIKQYEQESTAKNVGVTAGEEKGVSPEAISADVTQKERGIAEPIPKEEPAGPEFLEHEKLGREYVGNDKQTIIDKVNELGGIDNARELYKSEGWSDYGEPLEQFILRKACE